METAYNASDDIETTEDEGNFLRTVSLGLRSEDGGVRGPEDALEAEKAEMDSVESHDKSYFSVYFGNEVLIKDMLMCSMFGFRSAPVPRSGSQTSGRAHHTRIANSLPSFTSLTSGDQGWDRFLKGERRT